MPSNLCAVCRCDRCQAILLLLCQRTGSDIAQAHSIDIIISSGGPQHHISLIEYMVVYIRLDRTGQPSKELCVRGKVQNIPGVVFSKDRAFQHLRMAEELTVALIDGNCVITLTAQTCHNGITGMELAHRGQLILGSYSRAAIVQQHLIKALITVNRLGQDEILVAVFPICF